MLVAQLRNLTKRAGAGSGAASTCIRGEGRRRDMLLAKTQVEVGQENPRQYNDQEANKTVKKSICFIFSIRSRIIGYLHSPLTPVTLAKSCNNYGNMMMLLNHTTLP